MSDNKEMIKYFINDFYRAKKSGLLDMVTPTFRFKPPLKPEMNFQQYQDYIGRLVSGAHLIVHDISSDDNATFNIDYTLETLSVSGGLGVVVNGQTIIKVLDGLVDYVEIVYDASQLDPQMLAEFRAELYKP